MAEMRSGQVQNCSQMKSFKAGIQGASQSHVHLKPRLFDRMITPIEDVIVERDTVRLPAFNIALSKKDETLRTTILEILGNAGFQPLTVEELCQALRVDQKYLSEILKLMVKEGSIIRINDSLYITSSVYKRMIDLLKDFSSRKTEILVSEFREILGTSRKYALPFSKL